MTITKSAMVTIAGRPNVGKSTLTNALAGEKIAIVSNKPQTTRNRISAVVNRDDTQIVFMDTPGYHKARNKLGDYMDNVVKEEHHRRGCNSVAGGTHCIGGHPGVHSHRQHEGRENPCDSGHQ